MKPVWTAIGFIVLAIAYGGFIKLILMLGLIVAFHVALVLVSRRGLDRSLAMAKKELSSQFDLAKAKVVMDLVSKMEDQKKFMERGALCVALGTALLLQSPVVPIIILIIWMFGWQFYISRKLQAA